ncbi:hypothetical protein [Acidicapsa ligni]|uniref:hypothetical protein n=1 Tax=Acidicapsa ligni TaxID=542300 RepID=UPI0021DF6584|nr:hypothetical protein [Acidicapsa ligni]
MQSVGQLLQVPRQQSQSAARLSPYLWNHDSVNVGYCAAKFVGNVIDGLFDTLAKPASVRISR